MRAARVRVAALALLLSAAPAGAERAESPEYPHVRLTIDPLGGDHTWVLRIQNIDAVPLRLVADARLLSLDVTADKPHATTRHCTLPPEMRLTSDEEHTVIVPPRMSYVEAFDPRLYCFDARDDRALMSGGSVVGRFGFPTRRGKPSPPYVVASADPDSAGDRTPSAEIVGEPLSLPGRSEPSSKPPPAPPAPPATETASSSMGAPSVSTPARMDATSLRELSLPVTVTNPTPRTMHLLLRPETIAIDATGPRGTTRCQWTVTPAPIAELFTTLAPHAGVTTEVLVAALCPASFFDRPGLYSLHADLDTSQASGATIGIRSFVGEAASKSSTLLRLRAVRTGLGREP